MEGAAVMLTEDQRAACTAAIASLRQGRPEDVPRGLERLTKEDPEFAEGWQLLGIALARLGQESAALDVLRSAVSDQGGAALAHYNLGVLHLRMGDEESAVGEFAAAVVVDASLAQAHQALAAIESGRLETGQERVPGGAAAGSELIDEEPGAGRDIETGDPRYRAAGTVVAVPFLLPSLPPRLAPPPPGSAAFRRPFSARLCLKVAVDGVRGCAGDAGLVALVFVGVLAAMYAVDWGLCAVLEAAGLGMVTLVHRAGLVLVALLVSAGMALVGIMLADTQLYGANGPSVDDLWAGFADWGVVAGTSFLKLLVFVAVISLGSHFALLWSSPWVQGVWVVLLVLAVLYFATRLWFPVHLVMSTDTGIKEAYRTSWEITSEVSRPLLRLQALLLVLLCLPVGPVVAARTLGLRPLAQAGLHTASLVLAVFLLPVVAAASGAAYRLAYVRKYPGATPFDWVGPDE